MARYQNILETIGNTPVVRLTKLAPASVNVYVKVEAFNPMGSVKDRLALAIIEDAERSGALKPGQTVIEATSGNTGIGLAMVCAQKGYPLVVTMAESFSVERRKLLRFLGARVVLTPAAQKGSGMLAKAIELAETHGWFLCRQFENPANAEVHARTTAREIIRDFADQRLDYFVTGFGTGGTLKGVASALKRARPDTRIVAAEPANAALLSSRIPQARDTTGGPAGSHPSFHPHPMQGWTPDFISTLTEQAVEADLIDEIVPVPGPQRVAPRTRARAKGRYFRRHLERRHARGRARRGASRAGGLQHRLHAAGHRRALSLDATVRRRRHRNERRGTGDNGVTLRVLAKGRKGQTCTWPGPSSSSSSSYRSMMNASHAYSERTLSTTTTPGMPAMAVLPMNSPAEWTSRVRPSATNDVVFTSQARNTTRKIQQ